MSVRRMYTRALPLLTIAVALAACLAMTRQSAADTHVWEGAVSGGSWGSAVTLDTIGSGGPAPNHVGEYPSLADVAGQPGIAYYDDAGNKDLRYIVPDPKDP